jgi:hypothetical protein
VKRRVDFRECEQGSPGNRRSHFRGTGTGAAPSDLSAIVEGYVAWLELQPLAPSTRRAYRTKVAAFVAWLVASKLDAGDPLADPHARDFKGQLKEKRYPWICWGMNCVGRPRAKRRLVPPTRDFRVAVTVMVG